MNQTFVFAILFAVAFAAVANAQGNLKCTLCEKVVDQLKAKNVTVDQATQIITAMCAHVPEAQRQQCTDAAITKATEIVNELNMESSEKICQDLKVCPASLTVAVLESESASKLTCNVCEKLTTSAQAYIKSHNITQDQVDGFLDQLCAKAPAAQKEQCETAVKAKGDAIYQELTSGTAEQVCTTLKLCSASAYRVNKIDMCGLCEKGMGAALNYLKQHPISNDQVQAFATQICSKAPQEQQQACIDAITQKGEAVIQMLENDTPEQACQQIKLCQ